MIRHDIGCLSALRRFIQGGAESDDLPIMVSCRGGRRVTSVGLGVVLVALLAGGFARPAAASEEEGRRLFRRGQELVRVGDYRGAARAFEAGHAAAPRVGFLLNIGNCYRKLGELGRAREYYRRFLDESPADHASRADVEGYLRAIDEIEADGLVVDGQPPAPLPPAPEPPPSLSLVAAPLPRSEPAQPPVWGRWWVWSVVGGALAAGAAAYVMTRPGPARCGASLGCAHE